MTGEFLDFEILSEPWNRYRLEDGTIVKTRFILAKARLSEDGIRMRPQMLAVVETDDITATPPKRAPTADEIARKIIQKPLKFFSIRTAPSVYRFKNGNVLIVNTELKEVTKVDLYGVDGERIFNVETGHRVELIHPPPESQGAAAALDPPDDNMT